MTSYDELLLTSAPSPGERASREFEHMLGRQHRGRPAPVRAVRRRGRPAPPSRGFIHAPASNATSADRATTTGAGRPSPDNTTTSPGSLTIAAASVFSAPASQPGLSLKTPRRGPMVSASARSAAARCPRSFLLRARAASRAWSFALALQPLDAPSRGPPARPTSARVAAGHDVAERAVRAQRPAAADERQTRVAPLNRSHAGDGDRRRSCPCCGHVRAAAGRQIEVRSRRPAAAARSGPAPCAAAARAASSARRKPDRDRPVLPDDRLASRSAAAISAGVTSRARSIVDALGAEVKARRSGRRTADRTRPTARAGRCAAACDRSRRGQSISPCTRRARRQRAASTTCANHAVLVDRRRRRRARRRACPVSNGWPPDVG